MGMVEDAAHLIATALVYEQCWSEYAHPKAGEGEVAFADIVLKKATAHQLLINAVREFNERNP